MTVMELAGRMRRGETPESPATLHGACVAELAVTCGRSWGEDERRTLYSEAMVHAGMAIPKVGTACPYCGEEPEAWL